MSKHNRDWLINMGMLVNEHLHDVCYLDDMLSMYISALECTVLELRGIDVKVVLGGLSEQAEINISDLEAEMSAKAALSLDEIYD